MKTQFNSTPRLSGNSTGRSLPSNWIRTLGRITQGHKLQFAIILAGGLASNLFISIVNPLALKMLFDQGIIKKRFFYFLILSFASLLVFTVWRGILYWYKLYLQDFKNKVLAGLVMELLQKYYCLPYSRVCCQETGYFVSRIYDETAFAVLPIIDSTTALFNSFVAFIATAIMALLLSWRATAILIAIVPGIYFLSAKFGAKIKKSAKSEKEQEALFRGVLARSVAAYKVTRVFGLHAQVCEKNRTSFNFFMDAFWRRFKDSAIYGTLAGICSSFAECAVTVSAGYEMLAGRMSFGGFIAFMNAFWMCLGSARAILDQFGELPRIIASVERLNEFEAAEEHESIPAASNVLLLRKAAFGYEGQPEYIFKDFDLTIRKSERILIIGPNGAGKSTLANVLCGLLRISSGEAQITPLSGVSVLTCPMNFIPGTVHNNFSFGDSVLRKNIFHEVTRDFEIAELLERDPVELSAGQQQRVHLAMALMKDADFYILDEPLAHIDTQNRASLMDHLLRYTEGKGLIVIMHGDTGLYDRFDRILRLEPFGSKFEEPARAIPLSLCHSGRERREYDWLTSVLSAE